MLALYNYNDSSKNRVLETLDQISYNEMNFKFMPITYYHDRLFMTSLSMYNDHKILGIGSNLFRSKCPEYNEDLSECNSHPHNYYFQILAENGLVGFFSMVLIFLFFLKKLTFHFFSLFAQRFKKFNLKDHQLIIVALILVNLNPFFLTQSFYNQWSVPLIFLPFAFYFFFSINKT